MIHMREQEERLKDIFINSKGEDMKLLFLSGLISSELNISAEDRNNNLKTLRLIEKLLRDIPSQKRLHDICISGIKALEEEGSSCSQSLTHHCI